MTNIITRYFENAETARAVERELVTFKKFPLDVIDVYTSADSLGEKLGKARVLPETISAYQSRMKGGGAVVLVRATSRPLGVARITREVTAEMGAADMGDAIEEVFFKDPPEPYSSVFKTHPLVLSKRKVPGDTNHYMANWPLPLISRRKPFTRSIIEPHGHMANWPIPLISKRKPADNFAIPRHGRMAAFPIPLISRRKPKDRFAIPRHGRMANFPLPLLSDRKPYTGSIIARHARMANWPFPHLINGKTGTNSLMPGAPRMANFPISLLSDRKPYTASAIPRHARMANFPISLISKRKPYDKSAIPRHGRMADAILPLLVKHGETTDGKEGFSLSKLLGWPTISRR